MTTAAALQNPTTSPSSSSTTPSAGPPFGIGVIGAGQIVKRHAVAYQALPGLARLVAVADLDARRASEAKDRYGFAHGLTDHRELLQRDDVHCISVCTPPHVHARIVIDAIRAGKHVLCEKPMATTLADADAILRACDERPDVRVGFVFQMRLDAAHQRIRRLIEAGSLGRVFKASLSVAIRKTSDYYTHVPGRGTWAQDGGGVLINQAVHQLDSLLTFMGRPVEVAAAMDTFVHPIEAEDTFAGWVRFENGAIATIECCSASLERKFALEVTGEHGSLRVGGNPDGHMFECQIKARGSAARNALKRQAARLAPMPKDPPKLVLRVQKTSAKIRHRDWLPPGHWEHIPIVRGFLESVRDGVEPPVSATEARRSLELATALYQAAIERRTVSLSKEWESPFYSGFDAGVVKERSAAAGSVASTMKSTPSTATSSTGAPAAVRA